VDLFYEAKDCQQAFWRRCWGTVAVLLYWFKFILISSTFTMASVTLRDFSAPSRSSHREVPPSCHPILTPGYEIPTGLIAMVWSQSFSGPRDENPYTHLREFEQNCSIISIQGMHHKTVKWKLFSILFDGSCQRMVFHNCRKCRERLECSKREVLSLLLPFKEDHCPSYGSCLFRATRGRITRSSMGSLYRADFFRARHGYTRGYTLTTFCLWP